MILKLTILSSIACSMPLYRNIISEGLLQFYGDYNDCRVFSKGGGSLTFSDEFIKREGSEVQIILGLGLGLGRGLGGGGERGLQLSWIGTDF